MMQIYAHRGFSAVAPENTLSAFDRAIKACADGFELDVHLTADDELVVIHDERVDRTTNGCGWVKDLSLRQIRTLDSGSWFSPQYEDEKVPTLGEVLDLVRETDHVVNIELKNNVLAYPGIESRVVDEVERRGMHKRVILSSFNHVSLHHLHLYRPYIELGVLYESPLSEPWKYAKKLGASAIHPVHFLVTDEVVEACHQRGIRVRPFTVNEENEMRRLIDLGIDALITNVPDRLRRVLLDLSVAD